MRTLCSDVILAISVDLEPLAEHDSSGRGHDTVARLLDLLARHQLPATWAIANPAQAASGHVKAIGPHHELALRGDPTWTNTRIGQVRLVCELSRRLSAARDLGIVVASLAVEGTLAGLPAETLVEQGIRAVWSLAADESVRKPLMLRPNLWNLPVTRRMPIIKGWRMKTGDGVREALRRASAQQGVVHLAVDARAMAGGANFTALAGTFKSIAAAREEGEIRLATLASAAAELSQTRHSTPLRSILRAA